MKPERAKQEVPAEIMEDLLGAIKRDFCAEQDAKKWMQGKRFFMRVITFPAAELNKQGVTLAPGRYKEIVLEIFKGIKQHGATGKVKFWPGYLLHCVQTHWAMHGEEYYEEAKSIRAQADRAAMAYSRATIAPAVPDAIPALAAAHALLKHKPRKVAKPEAQTGEMFLGLES